MSGHHQARFKHEDGTSVFQSEEDVFQERGVAKILREVWNCELTPFGALAPIDYFAARHGRVSAVVEIKCRSNSETKYETVYLNVRKWLALGLAQVGLGVPALFVVQFTGSIRYISWDEIDGRNLKIGGGSGIVRSRSDMEPVIEICIPDMRVIEHGSDEGVS